MDEFPLIDTIDHEILMHRDVHFSGSFPLMLSYYEEEGKGTQAEFEIERIQELLTLEEQSGKNLSEIFLDEEEKAQVATAREKYHYLRDLCEKGPSLPQYLADLILSEEMDPQAEIDTLVKEGAKAVPLLIDLLSQDAFYNPLFPGYGLAPGLAAMCLGKIKAPEAISPLYEALGRSDFFTEDMIVEALKNIGEPAKEFLLRSLSKEPFSKDNENAAIALLSFPIDSALSAKFLEVLTRPSAHSRPHFISYLILGCEGLKDPELRDLFRTHTKDLPNKDAREEALLISKSWI